MTRIDRATTTQRRNRIDLYRDWVLNPDPEKVALGISPSPERVLADFEREVRADAHGMRLRDLVDYCGRRYFDTLGAALSGIHTDWNPTVPWTEDAIDAVCANVDPETATRIIGRSIGDLLVAAFNRDLSRGPCDECRGTVRHETHCSAYDASEVIVASAGGWPPLGTDPLDPRSPED